MYKGRRDQLISKHIGRQLEEKASESMVMPILVMIPILNMCIVIRVNTTLLLRISTVPLAARAAKPGKLIRSLQKKWKGQTNLIGAGVGWQKEMSGDTMILALGEIHRIFQNTKLAVRHLSG